MQPLKHFPNMPSKYKHMCKHNHDMAIESITVHRWCRLYVCGLSQIQTQIQKGNRETWPDCCLASLMPCGCVLQNTNIVQIQIHKHDLTIDCSGWVLTNTNTNTETWPVYWLLVVHRWCPVDGFNRCMALVVAGLHRGLGRSVEGGKCVECEVYYKIMCNILSLLENVKPTVTRLNLNLF